MKDGVDWRRVGVTIGKKDVDFFLEGGSGHFHPLLAVKRETTPRVVSLKHHTKRSEMGSRRISLDFKLRRENGGKSGQLTG